MAASHSTPYVFTPARAAAARQRARFNAHRIEGSDGFITLCNVQGEPVAVTVVDADLLPRLLELSHWRPMQPDPRYAAYYAGGHRRRQPGESSSVRGLVYLHRAVLELNGVDLTGRQVDHIDGDSLNNRRMNLRAGSATDNARNHRHNRREYSLVSALRQMILCTHRGEDCACRRAALAVLDRK